MEWLPQSSGIVVLRYFDGDPMVLVLYDKKSCDLPKGHRDPGESYLAAAIRETYEEASVDDLVFPWGEISYDTLKTRFFIAITEQDPYVKRNPVTGSFEHHGCTWMSLRKALKVLPSWAAPER